MSHDHAFLMHTYSLFNIFDICELFWDFFDCLLFYLFLILFTLVVSMAPKRKSTPTRNPLRSRASSSSDSAPLNLRFHDGGAHMVFTENFSRRGVHLERQVILADFADTDLPSIIHSWGWESLCAIPITCPLVLILEFYSNIHEIDRSIPLLFTCV